MHSQIERIAAALIRRGFAREEQIRKCTREEVEKVRECAGGTLPPLYEAFLCRMGRGAGDYASDVEMFFPAILGLRKVAEELLGDIGKSLPANLFVFSMLHSCAFHCFDPLTKDATVWGFLEGDHELREVGSLAEFFDSLLVEIETLPV